MAEESRTEIIEEEWDKIKIGIGVVCFVLILGGLIVGKYFLAQHGIGVSKDVKGAETTAEATTVTKKTFSIPTADELQKKFNTIQQQVGHLDVQEVASSSPQIQQILQQIQSLPNLPKNIAREQCISLCSKL